ncbi:MAG TPA: phage tail protein [Edaphobacter sp.]|nr:phage tail protein [Edaphobacter sp.]
MTNPAPNPFWQMPPLPQPPDDPTFRLLNGRVGWNAAELDGVAISDDRLGLLVLPGSGRLLTEPSGSFGGLVLPGNAALAPDGSIYLLDVQAGQVRRFDPCDCRFNPLPCLGGLGTGPRQVKDPRGIGICLGNLFLCDSGNHRLLVFARFRLALRGIWAPPSSAGFINPWQPTGIAFDRRRRVYVTDPANGCIHRFLPSGTWERSFPGFGDVRWIAIDLCDRIYTVSQGETFARISGKDGEPIGTASRPEEIADRFPSLNFKVDAFGNLDLSGLCQTTDSTGFFAPDGTSLDSLPPNPPVLFSTTGTYLSEALDSRFYRCQWHRILLHGRLPLKTAIRVSTFTSELQLPLSQIQNLPPEAWQTNQTVTAISGEWESLIFSGPGRYLWLRLQLAGNGSATPVIESIRLEYPRISLRRYLPAVFAEDPGGTNFTDRFLSIFDTSLRSIERKIDNEAAYFDPLSAPAVANKTTGIDFLSWLASWVGVTLDRQMPVAQRRQILKQSGQFLCIRGTRFSLWKQLLLMLGMDADSVCCAHDQPQTTCCPRPLNCAPPAKPSCSWEPPPLILEHYQLRRWLFLGQGRLGDASLLWGSRIVNRSQLGANAQAGVSQLLTTPDPFHDPFLKFSNRFTVFVPSSTGKSDQKRRSLINLLEGEKPAHTQYQIEYVSPRMRIGFQSMIGLDAVIARYPSGFKVGQKLGQDSVIGSSHTQDGPSWTIGRNSLIGGGAKLDESRER